LQYLDIDEKVVSYTYEKTVIPYISNLRTKKVRKYYPDFLITYVDGTQKLVEIKPSKRLEQGRVVKKINAAREWCKLNGITFEILTEVGLKALGLMK
jgi:hypothetical protein